MGANENIVYDSEYPKHQKETQMDLFNNEIGRQKVYGSGWVLTTCCDGVVTETKLFKNSDNDNCDDCNITSSGSSSSPNGSFYVQPAVINSKLENVLMPFQLDWLYDNILQANEILDYLDDNNDSQEAKAYVLNAIVRLADEENPDVERMITALEIEDKIKTDALDLCSKTIFEELKELEENDIADIIYRFDNPTSNYDWEMKSMIPLINPGLDAETDWKRDFSDNPIDYNYLTHIKPSYVNNATRIAIARTLLHEMLHTYLISLVDDAILTGSSDVTQFPLLWNALVNNTYNDNPSRLQHEIIGRNFIEPMRDALIEWDGGKESDKYYEDLAWGALENTSTFNTLFPRESSARSRILSRNKPEDKKEGNITPKATPC